MNPVELRVSNQIEALRNSLQRKHKSLQDIELEQSAVDREIAGRLEALEHNFGRLLLLVQGVVEIGHRQGWLTDAELKEVCAEIDLRDGVANDELAPDQVAGMKSPPEQTSLFSFFRNLEKRQSHGEFLKSLSEQPTPETPE